MRRPRFLFWGFVMDIKVVLTNADQQVVTTMIRITVRKEIVPQFLMFGGRLYQITGRVVSVYFYHEISSFEVVECAAAAKID